VERPQVSLYPGIAAAVAARDRQRHSLPHNPLPHVFVIHI
jgi:hypothetical protein